MFLLCAVPLSQAVSLTTEDDSECTIANDAGRQVAYSEYASRLTLQEAVFRSTLLRIVSRVDYNSHFGDVRGYQIQIEDDDVDGSRDIVSGE